MTYQNSLDDVEIQKIDKQDTHTKALIEYDQEYAINRLKIVDMSMQKIVNGLFDESGISRKGFHIAGGVIANLYHMTISEINRRQYDVDIFFDTHQGGDFDAGTEEFRALYERYAVEDNEQYGILDGKSAHAYLYESGLHDIKRFQLIFARKGKIKEDIVNSFDLLHCRAYYDCDDYAMKITPSQLKAIHTKTLVASGDPIPSRVSKWKARGFSY